MVPQLVHLRLTDLDHKHISRCLFTWSSVYTQRPLPISGYHWTEIMESNSLSSLVLVSLFFFGFFVVRNSIFIYSRFVHWVEPGERKQINRSEKVWVRFVGYSAKIVCLCVLCVCVCARTISGRGRWETPRHLWNRPVCGTLAWWWWRQTHRRWKCWMPGKDKSIN